MQNASPKDVLEASKEVKSSSVGQASFAPSSPVGENSKLLTIPQNFITDLTHSDEEEVSEVESFILDQEELEDSDASRFLLSQEGLEGTDIRTVDPETQARLEALLEAAGIGKLSTADGKALADPEVLRKLTSSVSCALDEAAAALTKMRAEQQAEGAQDDSARSLAKACSSGDIGTVRQLLDEGRSVHETTEEGESLLSLACSAGYYELAQVLLAMRANVEDRGIKGDCTPLMEAANGGYVDIVKLLIAHGADVNAQSSAGNTPLHYAACGGHQLVVKVLIGAEANVEEHNENGHTPLMEAASAGHVGVARILLDAGAGINTHSNEFKESALTLACYKGHLEMVKFLLEAGADQEHKTDEMHTALMEASMDGHVEVARLLLDSGAHVNMPADSFESPLTLAACGGHVELANLLIERGANLEEVNDEGYTPLMEAAREGHEDMVALLLAHGADINAQTEETQETALTLACCGGFLEVAEFLIKAGSDIELGCSTPLMEAAQEGQLELVKHLLKAGADVRAQTQTGDTALTYACENGHTDVVEVLLEAGAELEHESEGGRTPLMKAARAGHLCTVQFLISKTADVNRQTSTNDHTVLSLACAGGHFNVVDLLLRNSSDSSHKLKDGSTMLIEAAKGGHTNVVNLLLDWPSATSPDLTTTQVSPPHSTVDINDLPRVPIQGLRNIVPPQDPDQLSGLMAAAAASNNLSTAPSAVPQIPGQINLKDFNIPTKSVEQIQQTMVKSMAKTTRPPGVGSSSVTSSCSSTMYDLTTATGTVTALSPVGTTTTLMPAPSPSAQNMALSLTAGYNTAPGVILDPRAFTAGVGGGGNAGVPPTALDVSTMSMMPMLPNALDSSSFAGEAYSEDVVSTSVTTTEQVSTTGSTLVQTLQQPNQQVLLQQQSIVFPSTLLGPNAPDPAQLLAEAGPEFQARYEKNYEEFFGVPAPTSSESMAASTPVSDASLVAKVVDSEEKMNEIMKASERLEGFINKMMRRAELLNTTSEEQLIQKQQILEELQKVEQELQEKAKNPLLLLNARSRIEPDRSQTQGENTDANGKECNQVDREGKMDPNDSALKKGADWESSPLPPVMEDGELETYKPDLLPADEDVLAQMAEAAGTPMSPEHNGGVFATLLEAFGNLLPRLAKQESLSSVVSIASSSDSGCGTTDTNCITSENQEVESVHLGTVLENPPSPEIVEAVSPCEIEENLANDAGAMPLGYPTPEEQQAEIDTHSEIPLPSEASSRASSEEVDLTNVIPMIELKGGQTFIEVDQKQALALQQQQQQQMLAQLQQTQWQFSPEQLQQLSPQLQLTPEQLQQLQQMVQQQQQLQQQQLYQLQVQQHQQQQLQQQQQQHQHQLQLQQAPSSKEAKKRPLQSIQPQSSQPQQQQQQHVSSMQHLAQQALQTIPVQLEPLLQTTPVADSDPVGAASGVSSCLEEQLAAQATWQLQAQMALQQQLHHELMQQLKLQHEHQQLQQQLKQLQLHQQPQTGQYAETLQQWMAQQQQPLQLQQALVQVADQQQANSQTTITTTTHTCTTTQQYAACSATQQLKLQQVQQHLQQLHQQLQHVQHLQTTPQQLSQIELLQQAEQLEQQLEQAQQIAQQQQKQAVQLVTAARALPQVTQTTSQSSTQATTAIATQLLTQQDLLQQAQQLQQQLQHTQQLQQLAQKQQYNQFRVPPPVTNSASVSTNTVVSTTSAVAGSKKVKKKFQLLNPDQPLYCPTQQQQLQQHQQQAQQIQLQQAQIHQAQVLLNNHLNTQYANYTTNTAAAAAAVANSSTLYNYYLEMMDPSSTTPLAPNPSPASPQISPPVYPSIDLDAQTESNHDTALTLACAGGHTELVSLLLSRGADIEHRDKKGFTPLILAATAGHAEVVEILLDHGADIEAQSERTKDTPLSLACSGGRYEVVELLLGKGSNKEHRNVSDYTPLSLAASGGYVNIIKLLLNHGAEINSRTGSKLGISPLMLAAMNGHTQAVTLLLDRGSDINAQIETNKNTALTLACFQGRHEVVSLLVDRKANIEHRAKTGLTPLMEAASGGYVDVGRVLLDKGADVNAPPVPSSRDTALTIAADKGHYRFVDLLLSRGAAIDVKNKKGNSPLWLACNGGHLDVVQLLVNARADVDSQDNRKVSCLMAAFRKGHVKVVKWLVRHVTQFPSDQECMRYIATVTDKELLKKCHQCMEIIVSAKERQAAEANKNASILLEQIDAEKSREESKKAAAARKREKKREKKKKKQEHAKEMKEKEQKDKDVDDKECHSKSTSPEPETTVDTDTISQASSSSGNSIVKSAKPVISIIATTNTTSATVPIILPLLKKTPNNNSCAINNKNKDLASNSSNIANNKNIPTSQRDISAKANGTLPNSQLVSKNTSSTYPLESTKSVPATSLRVHTEASKGSVTNPSTSTSNARKKDKKKTSKDRDKMVDKSTNQNEKVDNFGPDEDENESWGEARVPGIPSQGMPQQHSPSINVGSHKTNTSNKKHLIPKLSTTGSKLNAGIGELDDFGNLISENHGKDKRTPEKSNRIRDFEYVASGSLLSPGKNQSLKTANTPSPKKGQKKEEGWKEVIRKSVTVHRSKKVSVPSNAISRVIGRSGCNINAIREVSGAHIEIDKAKPNQTERLITIKGSAEATRQAHNLISALIKDPEKDLEHIIPKLKNRVISTNTLTMSSNMWHNSMANGIMTTSNNVSTTTSNSSSVSGSVSNPKSSSSSKTHHPSTRSTSNATIVTTTTAQAVSGSRSPETSSSMAHTTAPSSTCSTSSNTNNSNVMSNIGVFHMPIGVWNMTTANSSSTTATATNRSGGGQRFGSASKGSAAVSSTPSKTQGTVARQLFPNDSKGDKSSSTNSTVGKSTVTYTSPSMAKTKVVTVASPVVAARVESKDSTTSFSSIPAHISSVGGGVRPGNKGVNATMSNHRGPPTMAVNSHQSQSVPQPLPIKNAPGQNIGKPGSANHHQANMKPVPQYSPFNNMFSPMAQSILSKKDEMASESKMNFASVAAAGVVSTATGSTPPSTNVTSSTGNTPSKVDPNLEAKAPGYKAPGQRTSSPQVGEGRSFSRNPENNQSASPYENNQSDFTKVPGYHQPNPQQQQQQQHNMGMPAMAMRGMSDVDLAKMMAIGNNPQILAEMIGLQQGMGFPSMPSNMNARPSMFDNKELAHLSQLLQGPLQQHIPRPPHQLQHQQQPNNLSPKSSSSTPIGGHSPRQDLSGLHRDEYSMPNQPMTLPKIESNLNPNAPDFTSSRQSQTQLEHMRAFLQYGNFNQSSMPFNPAFMQQQPPQPPQQQSQSAPQQQGNPRLTPQQQMLLNQSGPLGDMASGQSPDMQQLSMMVGAGATSGRETSGGFGGPTSSMADSNNLSLSGSAGSGGMRQYNSMPPPPARSASTASSVGTSSKGEGSPVPPRSGDSSPLSSSAPSPTDQIRMYSAATEERRSLRPIGGERGGKKEMGPGPGQGMPFIPGGNISDAGVTQLWGLNELGGSEWLSNTGSIATNVTSATSTVITASLPAEGEDMLQGSHAATPSPMTTSQTNMYHGALPGDPQSMDPNLENVFRNQAALLAPTSSNPMFVDSSILKGMQLPVMFGPAMASGSGDGMSTAPGTNLWSQQSGTPQDSTTNKEHNSMWNSWTPPPGNM